MTAPSNTGRKPPPAVLEVRGLRVWREGGVLLREVNWRVDPGQHWVVLGANGSGKTSLLAALTGYLTPSTGEIWLLGQRYGQTDWPALRRQVGLASLAISRWMPDTESALDILIGGIHDQIDFWGRATPADKRLARRWLRQVECGHLADRPWGFLSQGERQRIMIARALISDPKVLILDEPCAGLDPVAREHFVQFLQRLGRHAHSPAIVLVTHHVEEITPAFTHALLLREGRVIAAGPRNQVLTTQALARAFGRGVRLRQIAGRYSLHVSRLKTRVQ